MANTAVRPLEEDAVILTSSNSDKEQSPNNSPSLATYSTLCLVSGSVVLLEIVLTRVFAFLLWAHLAFMVVGTALFGFALSGLYLALKKDPKPVSVSRSCILGSLSILLVYAVIRFIPLQPWDYSNPVNFIYLAMWYGSLVLPFFHAGVIIASILGSYPHQVAKLYGYDLLSASCGALLAIPLMPLLGGEGALIACASLFALGALVSADSARSKRTATFALATTILLVWAIPTYLPLVLHHTKRRFNAAQEKGLILATRWSSVSRVDIAEKTHLTKKTQFRAVWIDGGTNHSGMVKVTQPIDQMAPLTRSSVGVAYALKQGTQPKDLIIGSSGGNEVLYALTNGASHVDACELDPSVVKFVTDPRFTPYMGHLFQNPRVILHNDEGRAFLRRQPRESYDVIQFVNNYTPVAIGSGALNLTESYLLTTEALWDFYDHLKPGGILALHRGATLRVATTALQMLEERGIENPDQSILITNGEWAMFEGFLLKKGAWTAEEIKKVDDYMSSRPRVGNRTFVWNPLDPAGSERIYRDVITATPQEREKYYTQYGVNLFPTTDDRPFMEHYLQIGKRDIPDMITVEFRTFESQKLLGRIPRGDAPYVAILVESILFAVLLIAIPLIRSTAARTIAGLGTFSTYYAALGFGFIVVELCLMKRYVLYLGSPAYSITAVLVLLLIGAGAGSLCVPKLASKVGQSRLWLLVASVAAAITVENFFAPVLLQETLALVMWQRVAVVSAMLIPLGFFLGLPFTAGMQVLGASAESETNRKALLAWCWGMNGLFTVIGSAATVFLALWCGFSATLGIATATYVVAALLMMKLVTEAKNRSNVSQ